MFPSGSSHITLRSLTAIHTVTKDGLGRDLLTFQDSSRHDTSAHIIGPPSSHGGNNQAALIILFLLISREQKFPLWARICLNQNNDAECRSSNARRHLGEKVRVRNEEMHRVASALVAASTGSGEEVDRHRPDRDGIAESRRRSV